MSSSVSAWFHPDDAAGEGRLGDAYHRVERVPVAPAVADQVAIVDGIDGGRGEEAVENQLLELLVVLVLVAAPLRNLDAGEQVVAALGHGGTIGCAVR